MLLFVIVACEVLFWVFIAAGLIARYPLRRPRAGLVLLALAPLVDLILLVATVLDLRAGATPSTVHTLAAVYIGVSIGFGHSMIRWADEHFAHRFAGGPAPTPKPKQGPAHAARERSAWLRHLLAWAVGAGLMLAAAALVGTDAARQQFLGTAALWTVVLLADGLWSFSYTFFPRRPARL